VQRGSFRVAVRSSPSSGPRGARDETPYLGKFGRAPTSARRSPSTSWRRRLSRSTCGIVLLLSAACFLSPVAGAATVAGAGTITTVADPGITLHAAADGRLDGDGFAVDISGHRFAYQLGFGPSSKDAAAGQALLLFGLSGTGGDITVKPRGRRPGSVSIPH